MTKTEHQLNKLSEECIEVAQRCSKAMRFGVDEVQPEQFFTNAGRIRLEFAGVIAAYNELMAAGIVKWPSEVEIDTAQSKFHKYLEYSEKCGTLNP